jgi:hypothetical protein
MWLFSAYLFRKAAPEPILRTPTSRVIGRYIYN